MSDSAILCDTEVTTAAAEKFTDASDGIRITYNKIKEANTELSESWKGKGGEYFTVMGNKTLKATEDSGIFTDEAAKTAFEIVHRFKEIDESSADILPDDFRGKCGLLDLNRNDPLGLGINFDSIPEQRFIQPVAPVCYGEIWSSMEPVSATEGVIDIGGSVSIGMAAYAEGAFVGDFIGRTTSEWIEVQSPLLH